MTTPIHLVTGFLGSGKTTLMNLLLSSPAMSDSAILINEFGEIAIDNLLVERIEDEIVVLESGCVCCSVKDDLASSLLSIQDKQNRNLIPAVRRILLETTGIADPLPICQQIMTDETLVPCFRNGAITTVVDAVYGNTNLDTQLEAVRQVTVADNLVVSKTDLVTKHDLDTVTRRLQALNPGAVIDYKELDANVEELVARLETTGFRDEPEKWLSFLANHDPPTARQTPKHDARFSTFCIGWEDPIDWDSLRAWLEGLLIARGEQIFRLKGIVNVEHESQPIVIQGVQHSFYPPTKLPAWRGNKRTELVFITQDFPREAIVNSIYEVLKFDCQ